MIFFWILVLMFLGIPVLSIAWELFKAMFCAALVFAGLIGIGVLIFSH